MARIGTARKAAVVAAVAGALAAVAFAAAAGAGLLSGPGLVDNAAPADDATVGVAIVPDDMPAVGDGTGDKKHYVVEASDSPSVGP